VRFTTLLVPVVGMAWATRTYLGRHFGPRSAWESSQAAKTGDLTLARASRDKRGAD